MRLINADELKKELKHVLKYEPQIVHTIVNEAVNDAPTIDQWHYPSRGEYPDENGEYLFLIEAFSNIYRVVGDYEVLKNQRLWSAQVADEWVEDEPIAWMPLPEPPKEYTY